MSTDTKESLFQSLVEKNDVCLDELVKEILMERLQKKAFDIFTAEQQNLCDET